jgi:hypothetical protein
VKKLILIGFFCLFLLPRSAISDDAKVDRIVEAQKEILVLMDSIDDRLRYEIAMSDCGYENVLTQVSLDLADHFAETRKLSRNMDDWHETQKLLFDNFFWFVRGYQLRVTEQWVLHTHDVSEEEKQEACKEVLDKMVKYLPQ